MPKWTKAQREAIYSRNDMLLVSAAAGSGKTAVLVERILTLIRSGGMDISRMLVVTFTRAAAAEMRERILKALYEAADGNEALREQAMKVDRASISTLHVFCGQVIREHFQAAGIDPTARLVEGGEKEALFHEALQETLLRAFEEGKPGFEELSDQFDDGEIEEMVSELYRFLMSLPEPWRWLHRRMADFPDGTELNTHPWTQYLLKSLKLQLDGNLHAASELLSMMDDPDAEPGCEPVLVEDIRQIRQIKEAAEKSMEELRLAFEKREFPRFPSLRGKSPETAAWGEQVKNQRTKIRNMIGKLMENVPGDFTLASQDILHTKPAFRALLRLARKLYKRYDTLKKEKNVYDFNDLEHKTLSVLRRADLRDAVKSRYDAVFIDEYQDISGIQEAILQAVHGGRGAFLVGDVKQSIYRFRLADPTLFLNKAKEASAQENASFRRISLQENFRCAKPVIHAVNQVFESVMREDVTEIAYDSEAQLVNGRETDDGFPVELHVLVPPEGDQAEEEEGENPQKAELEAYRAAMIIRRLRSQQLKDKDAGIYRDYRFRDIAVLLPKAKSIARLVADVLQKEGIPVYSEADDEYFGLPEIATMMAILQVLDNPLQDIPLMTALRSPCFALDEETMAMIRLSLPGRDVPFHEAFFHCAELDGALGNLCASVAKKMETWRFLSGSLPLDKLIWLLLNESGIYTRSGALPAGELRQANLRLLCQRAVDYEQAQGDGLHGFLLHGENLKRSGDSTAAKVLGETEDVVRIMTIHKSKGLEFPAVLVLGLGARMHGNGRSSPLKMHKDLGLSIPCIYPEARIRKRTLAEKAIILKTLEEEKAERARLLYVAMTRAVERLFLIGSVSGKDPVQKWNLPVGSYRIWQAGSMLDWIAQAVYPLSQSIALRNFKGDFSTDPFANEEGKTEQCTTSTGFPQDYSPWKVFVWNELGKMGVEKKEDIHTQKARLLQIGSSFIDPKTASRMTFSSETEFTRLPLKTSVSSLCKQRLLPGYLPGEGDETPESKGRPEEMVLPLRLSALPQRPVFLEQKADSPADLGTATHKALGCLPLAPLSGKRGKDLRIELNNGLEELENQGLLTSAQRNGLYMDWLTRFFESDLGKRLLLASHVHREWAFNLLYHKNPVTLLQGVIDCCFLENGQWVLIDYKTDFVQEEKAAVTRYTPQLQLYRRALEKITQIPVKEASIILLRSGKAIRLKEEDSPEEIRNDAGYDIPGNGLTI